MADEVKVEAAADEENRCEEREEARDLERVTDFVEESELDADRMSNVMSIFEKEEKTNQAAKAARDKELRLVKVDPNNVKLVAAQMDIDEELAEQVLRESSGDPVEAFRTLLRRKVLV
uniref:Nascent polypeptide-associated complex subunit alpha-like UBA domain-containing protein n=1 Tax=Spongospora subterranea TaxID=70186 RepID=A0A0H5R794_9EUKA|eukprot:CRZ09691.1 hypothetical protein [Spongospora subterranea]